jgi:hypothetical protein
MFRFLVAVEILIWGVPIAVLTALLLAPHLSGNR